jgi:hypothetical protein
MLNDSELARRNGGRIEIRPGGLRVRWDLSDLRTADGHTAGGTFACTICALDQPNELKMLEEALLSSRPVVTGADVVAFFAGSLLTTARKYARTCAAEALVADAGRQAMLAALMEATKAVAFGCGLEPLAPAQLDLDCSSLQREQIEILEHQTAQRRTAEQMDHLRRSAELFGQFETIRAAAPELSPGEVLGRIGLADQAEVLRSLLLAAARKNRPHRLWAVAGPYLIRIEGDDAARAELIPVPTGLGPMRSVRGDGTGGLLLGCRSGVMRINPDSPNAAVQYQDSDVNSQLGFNAAVMVDDSIWAVHGEAGLVGWKLDQPQRPFQAIRATSVSFAGFAPRNLHALASDRLIFSSGRQLVQFPLNDTPKPLDEPETSEILCIVIQPQRILSIHDDGLLCSRTRDDLKVESRQRRSGRVSAAAALPWLGDVRLLLADEDGPVQCIGPDDELVTQYTSAYRGMRMIAGSATSIAAATADRQRVVLWHCWDGRKLCADLHLYGLAKHRIADLVFA